MLCAGTILNSRVEEKKEAELCLDEKCRARKQPSSKSSEGEIEGGFMKCRAWRQISSEGGKIGNCRAHKEQDKEASAVHCSGKIGKAELSISIKSMVQVRVYVYNSSRV